MLSKSFQLSQVSAIQIDRKANQMHYKLDQGTLRAPSRCSSEQLDQVDEFQ